MSAQMTGRSKLILQDGTVFEGDSFGAAKSVSGECVFQTGMVGYPESLTDPSYHGQILVLSYPLIGNYGIPGDDLDQYGLPKFFESTKIWVKALVVAEISENYSHWTAKKSLSQWLQEKGVPAITGIDTRALIKKLREKGCGLAKVVHQKDSEAAIPFDDPNERNLVAEVSTKEAKSYGSGDKEILIVDCGMKLNQLRCFLRRGVKVKVVPWNHDISTERYDGLFITNGPGDPTQCKATVENLKKAYERYPPKPIFGICMGNQLMALAAGATTYKLPYGNRGHNQPCIDQKTQRCYLTLQNHGFAVDAKSLPANEWTQSFVNANDNTNEGIMHLSKPFFSVQFHPEACAGPEDTQFLFDKFLCLVRGVPFNLPIVQAISFSPPQNVRKILLLGSGGLTIGQAGEFDYSGSQAIKALKEEGIETVLINPNIATVQTSSGLADKVYFLPITPDFVVEVMEKERPDGILVTFGGQTALNCGIELQKRNAFEKLGVRVLGTPIQAIVDTEDRSLFSRRLDEINEHAAKSAAANNVEQALQIASEIGYPVIIRAAFALGGLGSGFANNKEELLELATKGFALADQVLVERSMKGWKEIEYEVVRDAYDNCVTVCNMENFDPLGIHTGESIVVAPSQTLSNAEYQMLRNVAQKVVRHLGVVGECNIQFALHPETGEYCIIEVNARLSRSSALASKATGYPLAFVAAKLALGHPLPKLRNSVTRVTTACFEPSLDYIVVKMPLWDLKKFDRVSKTIGTAMKSVGEVMSIGRTFEEAIQKAIRLANPSASSVIDGFMPLPGQMDTPTLESLLSEPDDRRIYLLARAFKEGYSIDRLYDLTKIDKWFLHKLKNLHDLEIRMSTFGTAASVPLEVMLRAKQLGFSDKQIARCVASTELTVRHLRKEAKILPFVKQIDTVAAEFPAQNNYLYMTYNGSESDVTFDERGIIVIGSGGYRIGTSVEFDWCAVGAIKTVQALGHRAIMVNCNPETVSTDYDVCDRLYFEEMTFERVLDIYEVEQPSGVILSVGGQIPNNLAMPLYRQNVHVYGTSPEMIDTAENRYKFSRLLDTLGISQPEWRQLTTFESARAFCKAVQYPCLVRPSYVLSGASMKVVYSDEDLESYLLSEATLISEDKPVVISKFISGAKEIEIDAVSYKGRVVGEVISEHVENAGVHSGDATIVCPYYDLHRETVEKIRVATQSIAEALNVSGPFNIQFIAKENEIKVIECNLRASRSLPFVSKTLKIDMVQLATHAILGRESALPVSLLIPKPNYVGVKVPQFSFTRLRGADPVLGVDMASTGEVACFGRTRAEAYLKALLATGFRLPDRTRNVLISVGSFSEKQEFVESAKKLVQLGYTLFGTPGTGDFLTECGVPVTIVTWDDEKNGATTYLRNNQIDLYINLPSKNKYRRPASFMSHGYQTRRLAIDLSVPLITNIKSAKLFVESLAHAKTIRQIQPHDCHVFGRVVTLPGLIDMHVHMREPGAAHKEDWETGTSAALAGGFTIVGAMPNTNPSIVDRDAFDLVSKIAAAKAKCDYVIYVGASSSNTQSISALADQAAALKMYLNETFSTLQLTDVTVWMEHVKQWPAHVPIAVHAEGKTLAAVLAFGQMFQKHIHVCHVSTREEIEIIKAAKQRGWQVTCEVCPHHLFLTTDHDTLHPGRSTVKPHLATVTDKDHLWNNIQWIDIIGTDHAPHLITEKDSEKPPPGFPGLETALPLMLTAVAEGKLSLEDLIAKMHTNPKKIFGLPEQPDTYVEVDLDKQWVVPAAMPFTKCKWTPYAGKHLKGMVKRVVIRGQLVYLDGKVLAPSGSGRDLRQIAPMAKTTLAQRFASVASESSDSVLAKLPSSTSMTVPLPSTPKPIIANGVAQSPGHRRRSLSAIMAASQEAVPHPLSNVDLAANVRDRFFGKNILTVSQFSHEDLHALFNLAHEMRLMVQRQGTAKPKILGQKVLATLFYEPSTRTCCSFVAAMERLGGKVIQVNMATSSVVKGESLADTIRTVESYADAIVLRHPDAGSAKTAAKFAKKPIINAGDGVGEHPTQALLDAFTIREELGTLNGLNITLLGDLKHGRTVHSLVRLLKLWRVRLHYVSPASLRMPTEITRELEAEGIPQFTYSSLDEVLHVTDVLYVTRVQKERFEKPSDYDAVKTSYVVTPATLTQAKENMIVMHPLPRVDEISAEVDLDPRAAYFRQMENGMYVRMALLSMLLGGV